MAKPRPPLPSKLMCALFSSSMDLIELGKMEMEQHFGALDLSGVPYKFTETDHYAQTMGEDLWKQLVSFEKLVKQEALSEIKNKTNFLEEKLGEIYKERGEEVGSFERPINLDPGLVTGAKLILATMKDFSHRLYLGNHVYGEVTLMYSKGQFHIQPWTYPDYQRKENLQFLEKVRSRYLEQLEELI